MRAYAATDVGLTRSVNQDYVYYSLEEVGKLPNLFIVADGMGGHKAGDIASRYTVETFVELVKASGERDLISIISNAINVVNSKIITMAQSAEEYVGMGTTLVVATIEDNVLKVANIGDSRLYVIGDDITQITRDHSYVEELVSKGEINREEARTHEKKNYITRAIGGELSVEAEMFCVDLAEGNRVLLCSDGLSNMVEDNEIFRIINQSSNVEDAVNALINEANSNGGRDNISAIIIEL